MKALLKNNICEILSFSILNEIENMAHGFSAHKIEGGNLFVFFRGSQSTFLQNIPKITAFSLVHPKKNLFMGKKIFFLRKKFILKSMAYKIEYRHNEPGRLPYFFEFYMGAGGMFYLRKFKFFVS